MPDACRISIQLHVELISFHLVDYSIDRRLQVRRREDMGNLFKTHLQRARFKLMPNTARDVIIWPPFPLFTSAIHKEVQCFPIELD